MRKIHHANTNQKRAGVALWISDKADFRAGKLLAIKRGIILW